MLEVHMNGTDRFCLIDTGCEQTMIPPRCAKGLRIKKTTEEFTNASDQVMKVLGFVELRIRLEDMPMDITAVVSPDCDEPYLGADWLDKYQVNVQSHEGTISVRGRKYKLQPRKDDPHAWGVIATETQTVPAKSAVIMNATFRVNSIADIPPHSRNQNWMAEQAEVQTGVFVSRTLLPQQSDNLPISIINITDKPVQIEKGTILTDATPVDVPTEQLPENEKSAKSRKRRSYEHLKPLMENLSPDMTRREQDELWDLLKSYADVFSTGKFDLGRTSLVSHKIDTGDAYPVKQRLRKTPWAHQDAIREERKDMSEVGVIKEHSGPWCSNVVIVTKKDGSPRFCIDYRKLNELTRKDAYPLPCIETCLDSLAGARYFSTFDLRSGYHQIPMHPESIEKTAFVTQEGTFAFEVMPFGLCNAGATFQRLMDLLMAGITYKICLVYLDDIIIFSRDMKQHMQRCKIVFQRLREAGLKLKVSKCNLVRDSVQFLGHVVSKEGIATDPEKVKAIKEWPQPKDLHELRSFYGLCSYYRKFVQDFAKIAAPMTNLMRAETKFQWTQPCEEAFEEMKRRLIESPILALPQQDAHFILDTDASNFAIGGVLSQIQEGQEKVIAYGSRSLTKEERNYCVTRRELLAVTEFLKKYRQYLLGRKFSVRTDHAALQWMRKTPEPIGQQARWTSLVEEFDFDIIYRAGKQHGNADALSRMPCQADCKQCVGKPNSGKICSIRPRMAAQETAADKFDDQTLAAATKEDLSLCHIQKWLRENQRPQWEEIRSHNAEVKAYANMWDRLSLRNGVICRSWYDEESQIDRYQKILPHSHRRSFVKQCHEGMNGGHMGQRRTMHTVQYRTYWKGWKTTVQEVLQQCEECQKYHRGKMPRQGNMQTMTMGAPWERIGIDITGPFPKSARGNRFMLTIVDHFSKWAEAFPISNHEATTVARVLIEQVIARFGVPLQILSDRGAEFESKLFAELCRVLGTDKIRTTAYKPSTNGMVERLHKSLNSMLAKCIDFQQRFWCEQTPIVMAAYRATRHEATGYTPNMLMFGRELSMPIDIVLGIPEGSEEKYNSANEYVSNLQNKFRTFYEKTRLALERCAERNKNYYDIRVKGNRYNTGDWVLYYLPKSTQGRCVKWEKLFSGPYLIVKKYDEVTFAIQMSKRAKLKTVHIDKLKPWYGETPETWLKNAENRRSRRI